MSTYQKILVIFGSTIGFIGLILIWVFVFNKGTIIVSGDAPFTISYGKGQEEICIESICEYELPAGKYNFTASKEGYQMSSFQAQIHFHSQIEWKVQFSFIPKIEEIGARHYINMPELSYSFENNLKQLSFLQEEDINLRPLSSELEKIIFDYSGQYAYVRTANSQFLLNTVSGDKASPFGSSSILLSAWNKKGNFYYLEEKDGQYLLQKSSLKGDIQTIVRFLKDPNVDTLSVSPDGKWLVMVEKESPYNWYLIGSEEKSRHKIDQPSEFIKVDFFTWNQEESMAMVSSGNKTWLFDPKTELFTITELPKLRQSLAYDTKSFIAIAQDNDLTLESGSTSYAFNFSNQSDYLSLAIYNPDTNNFESKELALSQSMPIENFDSKDNKLYFLSEENIYQIILAQ